MEIQVFITNQKYLLSPLKWGGHLDFQTLFDVINGNPGFYY